MTPPALPVRPRRDEDVTPLARLLLAQQRGSRYPHRDPLPVPAEDFVRRQGELAAFVAETDRGLVGHVAVGVAHEPEPGPEGDVERAWERAHARPWTELGVVGVLFTDPEARGTGVGPALLAAAVEEIRRRDLGPCLDVMPTNPRALALYRRTGWVEVGRGRPSWLEDDAPDLVAMVLR